jgi:hypothetical protein
MTQRAHFWLRIAGLAIILALEFGPRVWFGATPTSPVPVAAAAALLGPSPRSAGR